MPNKPPRPCRAPGCPAKTTEANGYCEKHQHLAASWSRGRAGQGRGGRPWRRKRAAVLERDRHLCQPCKRAGRAMPADQVDHIMPLADGGTGDDSNLEAICKDCHDAKTQREATKARTGRG